MFTPKTPWKQKCDPRQSSVKLPTASEKHKPDHYQPGPQEGLVPFYYPRLYGHRWWLECIHAGPSAVDTVSPLCILGTVLKKREIEDPSI